MTFKQVIKKNFIGNVKQYLSFFLCNIFTIMVFFMYCTLIFNKDITENGNEELFSYVLSVTVIGISVFSVLFLLYASSAFLKGKYVEIGLYRSLGMTKKEMTRLVNTEQAIIHLVSLGAALLIGALLSRMFQLAILKILDLQNVSFYLDYKSFITTILVFVVIFLAISLWNLRKMKRMDIMEYLKEEKKREIKEYRKVDQCLAMVGLVALVGSAIFLFIITRREEWRKDLVLLFCYLIMLGGGMYLTIAKAGRMLLEKIKRTKVYHKNLLSIAMLFQKFDQNKRILFVLSILSTFTILFVASPISLLTLSEEIAETLPNNVEYVQSDTINVAEEDKVDAILKKEEITSQEQIPFVIGSKEGKTFPIVGEDEFERKMGNPLSLQQGECANIGVNWIPGNNGMEVGDSITVKIGEKEYTETVSHAAHDSFFAATSYPCDYVIIVPEEEFERMTKNCPKQFCASYHLIQYKDWKQTKDLVSELTETLHATAYSVISTIGQYEMLKKSYATFLFISTVLAVLFFVSGGAVLYFRQVNELEHSRKEFAKLFKIGITTKEALAIVKKELRIIYFVPVVFGTFAGISMIYYLTNLFGGSEILSQFMKTSGKVIVVYAVCQFIFYEITKQRYQKELQKIA